MDHPTKQDQSIKKLTDSQIELAFELEQLNEIYAPFKLSDSDIERWVKRISEVSPELTPKDLAAIVYGFITGKYIFNKNIGIANIFIGYAKHKLKGMVY